MNADTTGYSLYRILLRRYELTADSTQCRYTIHANFRLSCAESYCVMKTLTSYVT